MVNRIGNHRLLNYASMVEQGTIDQAVETASMPFVHPHVALMPDAHAGKGSAVGTVIPTLGAVIPAAVGVDIGCGMIATRTCFSLDDFGDAEECAGYLRELREKLEGTIPVSPGVYNQSIYSDDTYDRITKLHDLAEERGVDLSHSPKWQWQLGSLGGGNHFIELCLDELDRVWLTLHSGSRGVGNKIAQKHIKIAQKLCKQWWIDLPNSDLAYLVQGTPEFSDYIKELNWAQQFAAFNRDEMLDRFVDAVGSVLGITSQEDIDAIEINGERINCHHNYTKMEHHAGKDVWVTRKGAVDAHEGMRAMIPGSMGTRSYIVTGKGDSASLCSAPHGAGRRFSRAEAKRRFTEEDLAAAMRGIEYRHGAQFIDEIPGAYKDIDQVMDDASDLVHIDHVLRQILNVKGE